MSRDICYHKVQQNALDTINEMSAKIQEELLDSQREAKKLLKDLMTYDSIPPSA